MDGRRISGWMAGIFLLSVLFATGCASGPGGFTIFPQREKLSDAADAARSEVCLPISVARELSKTTQYDYVIEPGDSVLVESLDFNSDVQFAGEQRVLPDGTIDLGLYGRLTVAGKTIESVERDVEDRVHMAHDNPGPINVRITDIASKQFYVLGEVNSPGSFPLIGSETVLDAILAAGGLSNGASPCDIILTRPGSPGDCRSVLPVCYTAIVQLGDSTTNYQMMPGDRIFVGPRSIFDDCPFISHGEPCAFCCGQQCPCGNSAHTTRTGWSTIEVPPPADLHLRQTDSPSDTPDPLDLFPQPSDPDGDEIQDGDFSVPAYLRDE